VQCVLQTLEGCPQLPRFTVVAGLVIEGDGLELGMVAGKSVSLLQEYESNVVLFFLQEDHGHQVAQFAHLDRNALVFLAICSEVVAVELQQLLVLVQSLTVLGLTLQLLALPLQRLHSLPHGRVHHLITIIT
jgi:hypothetical protein